METFPPEVKNKIERAAQLIKGEKCVVALTGAGISTPSGIPDFRSPGSGIWNRYQPMEVASLTAFRYDPGKFYDWLRPLAKKMFHAQPNPAHQALAKLEVHDQIRTVITQNIDTLHQRAGSQEVLEVHGTFDTLSCLACHQQVPATETMISNLIQEGRVPRCDSCGEIMKPDVVLFEEQLPAQTWKKAQQASQRCHVMLVLGSSLTVTPVSRLPLEAVSSGAKLVIINKSETYLDDRAQVVIHEDVARILPEITKRVIYDETRSQSS